MAGVWFPSLSSLQVFFIGRIPWSILELRSIKHSFFDILFCIMAASYHAMLVRLSMDVIKFVHDRHAGTTGGPWP